MLRGSLENVIHFNISNKSPSNICTQYYLKCYVTIKNVLAYEAYSKMITGIIPYHTEASLEVFI